MSLQISPDVEARIRAEAAARGVSVELVLDEATHLLANRRNVPSVKRLNKFYDARREMAWTANPDLQYVNQWVALEGDQVVSHGPIAKLVFEEAKAQGLAVPFMHFLQTPSDQPVFIGWHGIEDSL